MNLKTFSGLFGWLIASLGLFVFYDAQIIFFGMILAMCSFFFIPNIEMKFNRYYNERVEDYFNREYLDYSARLDNIVIPLTETRK